MKTTDKLEFTEYAVQYRNATHPGAERQPHNGQWQDASGYNNKTSTYNHISQAKAQISRTRRWLLRNRYTEVEFRILSRRVTRTEWEQLSIDA